MGFRSVYDDQAKYFECAPSSFSDRTTQQVRRATLLIGAMFLFKNLLLNKSCGKFGMIILPVHFVMDCVLPSLFFVGLGSLVMATILGSWLVLPLWVVAGLAFVVGKSRSLVIAFIQSQFSLVAALFKLASREQSLFITSIPSTRGSKMEIPVELKITS
jgi:hypothetical protein